MATEDGTRPTGKKGGDAALVQALATGLSIPKAAQVAGLSERTAYRRMDDPAFRLRVVKARNAFAERTLGRLASGAVAGAVELRKLLKAESESVKLGAAKALVELSVKFKESVEFEERLAALEAAQPTEGKP